MKSWIAAKEKYRAAAYPVCAVCERVKREDEERRAAKRTSAVAASLVGEADT